jgi:hypothetical protein
MPFANPILSGYDDSSKVHARWLSGHGKMQSPSNRDYGLGPPTNSYAMACVKVSRRFAAKSSQQTREQE